MLSDENKNKIITSGLYLHAPDVRYRGTLYADNLYHCMNWTFRPQLMSDGNYYMVDTYFNNKSILLDDDNFDGFQFIFDFNEVVEIKNPDESNEEEVFHVAIDSGGMYCGGKWFVKKGATVSKEKLINRCKDKIESAERRLENLKSDLVEFENGTHWKFR